MRHLPAEKIVQLPLTPPSTGRIEIRKTGGGLPIGIKREKPQMKMNRRKRTDCYLKFHWQFILACKGLRVNQAWLKKNWLDGWMWNPL
jgi:hypothetical protein